MKFTVTRQSLLKPLQQVTGVIERRQTLPILSNVLLDGKNNILSLTGSDSEVELINHLPLENLSEPGRITLPARKLMDIIKSLADDSLIDFQLETNQCIVRSGRSRFVLSTLPADEFPSVENFQYKHQFSMDKTVLKTLIEKTSFSIAQQDVRFYLNGMLFDIREGYFSAVATDGHRLAVCKAKQRLNSENLACQVIVPRKAILELSRLLSDELGSLVDIELGQNHIRVKTESISFTSQLVDGKFPDYGPVIPKNGDKIALANRQIVKQVLSRIAILANEKYRGIRIILSENKLTAIASNPEQEQAEEDIQIQYNNESIEIGFNVNYLLDVLSIISGQSVKLKFSSSASSVLIEETEEQADYDALYVIMPMSL